MVPRTCGLCQGFGRRLSTTLSEAGRSHAAVAADIWGHLGLLYFVVLAFMARKGLNHPPQVFQDLVLDEVLYFLALSQPVDHFNLLPSEEVVVHWWSRLVWILPVELLNNIAA